ncbi:MAG: serine/threonine protein kinase, partial [Calditrichaeota bacterium]
MIGKTVSHYQVVEKIGAGGMGVVYKARDERLGRWVALKFLHPHLNQSEEAKQRFIREARAASAIAHANIATVYEIDEADGRLFIAMEYVPGISLAKRLEEGPLEVTEAVGIAVQIARALASAHVRGIVHRDIKPANILISSEGTVKLVDFGLAKLQDDTHLTTVGRPMGTVAYMSPEQVRGEPVDYRSDIWALGVLLYEMLCGQHPFGGEHEQAVIYRILNESPRP